MRTESVSFPNAQGQMLAGRIDRPAGETIAYVLFAHHFAGSKDVLAAVRISRALTQLGFAVLRFDFTGLGASGGDFQETTFRSNICDIISAAQFLRHAHTAPQILVGHSLGGSASLAASSHIPEIKVVATIGSPSDPTHLTHAFTDQLESIEQGQTALLRLGGRDLPISPGFLADIRSFDLLGVVKALDAAVIVFHSPSDDVVHIDHARLIYDAARHPKSFVSLDQADHLLRDPDSAAFVAAMIAPWSKRHIVVTDGVA